MPTWLLWQTMPWRTQNLRSLRSRTCEDCCSKCTETRHFITMAIWQDPAPFSDARVCSDGPGWLPQCFYAWLQPRGLHRSVATHEVHSEKLQVLGELVIICGNFKNRINWRRIITRRLSSDHTASFVWHQTLGSTPWWNTMCAACQDWSTNSHQIQPEEPWYLWCTAAPNPIVVPSQLFDLKPLRPTRMCVPDHQNS